MKFRTKMWEKFKGTFLKRKLVRMLVLLFLSGLVCLSDNSLYDPSRIPDIVFVCKNYDEVRKEVCEITFIDKYGECYYSDDPYVCSNYLEDLINAYKAGEIEDKIQLRGSCSRNAVIKRYRKMYKMFKKKKIRIIAPNPGRLYPCVLTNQWNWYCLYFNEFEEVQCYVFHTKKFGDTIYSTDNKQANRIYEWCEEVVGEMELE